MNIKDLNDLAKWIENNCDDVPLIFRNEETQNQLKALIKF
jgi:hypothetical protein